MNALQQQLDKGSQLKKTIAKSARVSEEKEKERTKLRQQQAKFRAQQRRVQKQAQVHPSNSEHRQSAANHGVVSLTGDQHARSMPRCTEPFLMPRCTEPFLAAGRMSSPKTSSRRARMRVRCPHLLCKGWGEGGGTSTTPAPIALASTRPRNATEMPHFTNWPPSNRLSSLRSARLIHAYVASRRL